jgi:dynein heavy chain
MIQKLVKKEKELGPEFISPPPFDMEKSFNDSYNNVPIIIILSPGADPMSDLQKLAKAKNARVHNISLGQG